VKCDNCINYDNSPGGICRDNQRCSCYKPACSVCRGRGYEELQEDPNEPPVRYKCMHCMGSGVDKEAQLRRDIKALSIWPPGIADIDACIEAINLVRDNKALHTVKYHGHVTTAFRIVLANNLETLI